MKPRRRLQLRMDRRIALRALRAYSSADFVLVHLTVWSPAHVGAQTADGVLGAFLACAGLNAAAWASWGGRSRALRSVHGAVRPSLPGPPYGREGTFCERPEADGHRGLAPVELAKEGTPSSVRDIRAPLEGR